MKRTMRRVSMALAVGLFLSAGAPVALAQSDDPVDAAISTFQAKYNEARAAGTLNGTTYSQMIAGALEGVDVSALSVEQIQKLMNANLMSSASGKMDAFMERLSTLAEDHGEQGAWAASIRAAALTMIPPNQRGDTEHCAEILRAALNHPGLGEAMASGNATALTRAISSMRDPAVIGACAEDLVSMTNQMDEHTSGKMLTGINSIMDGLRSADLDKDMVEGVRQHLVALASDALERAATDPALMTEAEVKRLRRQHDLLDGAWGRGQLIGYEAPTLSFDWSSNPKIGSLEDLRGNVVVVDFWATWCGPCRASFPHVAALVEHYQGFPVRVLGVTSLQGYHIGSDAQNRERVDCAGDPQKEYGLMPQFMTDMGMTWDVAFTPTDVFNPQYGVNGIPHMTIIAPDGTVRYNGLHPAGVSLEQKAKMIDEILTEFNLPHPAAPTAEEAAGG